MSAGKSNLAGALLANVIVISRKIRYTNDIDWYNGFSVF